MGLIIKEMKRKQINKLLESKGAKINTFARLEKGEGIEKVEENFAEEVAKQIKG